MKTFYAGLFILLGSNSGATDKTSPIEHLGKILQSNSTLGPCTIVVSKSSLTFVDETYESLDVKITKTNKNTNESRDYNFSFVETKNILLRDSSGKVKEVIEATGLESSYSDMPDKLIVIQDGTQMTKLIYKKATAYLDGKPPQYSNFLTCD